MQNSNEQMREQLLLCPFCGHTTQHFTFDRNEYGQSWEIICEGCSVTIPVCDSQEEAIERWNTRAEAAHTSAAEKYEGVVEALEAIKHEIGNAIGSGAVNPQARVFGRTGLADRYAARAYDIANNALVNLEQERGDE